MEKCMRSPASKHDKNETVSDAFEKKMEQKQFSSSLVLVVFIWFKGFKCLRYIAPKDNLPVLEGKPQSMIFLMWSWSVFVKAILLLLLTTGSAKSRRCSWYFAPWKCQSHILHPWQHFGFAGSGWKICQKILNQMIEDGPRHRISFIFSSRYEHLLAGRIYHEMESRRRAFH